MHAVGVRCQVTTCYGLVSACKELEGGISWHAVGDDWRRMRDEWLVALTTASSLEAVSELLCLLATHILPTALQSHFDVAAWTASVRKVAHTAARGRMVHDCTVRSLVVRPDDARHT